MTAVKSAAHKQIKVSASVYKKAVDIYFGKNYTCTYNIFWDIFFKINVNAGGGAQALVIKSPDAVLNVY